MKLAYLAPLTVDTASKAATMGYDGLEARAGWMDGHQLTEIEQALPDLRDALGEHDLSITAVAIYGPTIETPAEEAIDYWGRAIRLARALGCSVVAGLTGRDNALSVDENLPRFVEYFGAICQVAEDQGVRLALEPWPGRVLGHGPYRWTNMATTPELWDRLFEAVPSPALGLEYDPSHLVWQGIDHLQAIRDYGERIHHVHAKDIVIDEERLRRVGVHGRGWWHFVLPGRGQIHWPEIFQALRDVNYTGDIAVEHEDREYLNGRESEGLRLALKALRPEIEQY